MKYTKSILFILLSFHIPVLGVVNSQTAKCSVLTRIARGVTDFGRTEKELKEVARSRQAEYAAQNLKRYLPAGTLNKGREVLKEYYRLGGRLIRSDWKSDYITPAIANLMKIAPNVDPKKAAAFLFATQAKSESINDLFRFTKDSTHYVFRQTNFSTRQVAELNAVSSPLKNRLTKAERTQFLELFGEDGPAPTINEFQKAKNDFHLALKALEELQEDRYSGWNEEAFSHFEAVNREMMRLSDITLQWQRRGLNPNLVKESTKYLTENARKYSDIWLNYYGERVKNPFSSAFRRLSRIENDYWEVLHSWWYPRLDGYTEETGE